MTARYLIVANKTLGGEHLLDRVDYYFRSQPDAHIHVLVPATLPDEEDMSDEAIKAEAQHRLDIELERFRAIHDQAEAEHPELGTLHLTGEVGDHEPYVAIETVLTRERFDEVVISTLPTKKSRWLRRDLPTQVRQKLGATVIHLETEE